MAQELLHGKTNVILSLTNIIKNIQHYPISKLLAGSYIGNQAGISPYLLDTSHSLTMQVELEELKLKEVEKEGRGNKVKIFFKRK